MRVCHACCTASCKRTDTSKRSPEARCARFDHTRSICANIRHEIKFGIAQNTTLTSEEELNATGILNLLLVGLALCLGVLGVAVEKVRVVGVDVDVLEQVLCWVWKREHECETRIGS